MDDFYREWKAHHDFEAALRDGWKYDLERGEKVIACFEIVIRENSHIHIPKNTEGTVICAGDHPHEWSVRFKTQKRPCVVIYNPGAPRDSDHPHRGSEIRPLMASASVPNVPNEQNPLF